jgi:putative ABC transport system permease protein
MPKTNAGRNPQEELRAPRYPFTFVSAGYFETLGIAVLQGRSFTQQEISSGAPVAVISSGLARKLFPGQDSLGKTIAVGSNGQTSIVFQPAPYVPSVEIIGVVQDIYSDSMMSPDPGAVYLPSQQQGWERILFIRTEKDPNVIKAALSAQLQSIDSNLAATLQSMDSVVGHDTAFILVRVAGVAFSAIGLLGVLLASLGIYGMVGYTVSQQTREIGIRMAMGAQRTDVLRLVLTRSLAPISKGILAGTLLGMSVSLLMSRTLPGLTFLDPATLLGMSLLIAAIAFVAAYIPARRATNLDPLAALRSQ